jgi:hypothetical protein
VGYGPHPTVIVTTRTVVELDGTERNYPKSTQVRLLSSLLARCNPVPLNYIRAGRELLQPRSTRSTSKTTTHDIGYYTLSGPNLSKLYISCTFEFLTSATPYLQLTTSGVSLGGLGGKTPIIYISGFHTQLEQARVGMYCNTIKYYIISNMKI